MALFISSRYTNQIWEGEETVSVCILIVYSKCLSNWSTEAATSFTSWYIFLRLHHWAWGLPRVHYYATVMAVVCHLL